MHHFLEEPKFGILGVQWAVASWLADLEAYKRYKVGEQSAGT